LFTRSRESLNDFSEAPPEPRTWFALRRAAAAVSHGVARFLINQKLDFVTKEVRIRVRHGPFAVSRNDPGLFLTQALRGFKHQRFVGRVDQVQHQGVPGTQVVDTELPLTRVQGQRFVTNVPARNIGLANAARQTAGCVGVDVVDCCFGTQGDAARWIGQQGFSGHGAGQETGQGCGHGVGQVCARAAGTPAMPSATDNRPARQSFVFINVSPMICNCLPPALPCHSRISELTYNCPGVYMG
jgi:hypothetical protein